MIDCRSDLRRLTTAPVVNQRKNHSFMMQDIYKLFNI